MAFFFKDMQYITAFITVTKACVYLDKPSF